MLFQYNEIQENDVIMWGEPLNAVIDTAAMITLINKSLIPDNQLAMIKLIKL